MPGAGVPLPSLEDAALVTFHFDDVTLAGYSWWADSKAPVFLLLHGWGEDATTLAPVARRIRGRAWHSVSISPRGWGGSTGVDDYGLSAPKDIGRVLDDLRTEPQVASVVLLGFSMGGVMASLAATTQTEVKGLIVVSAPGDLRSFYLGTKFGGVRRYLDGVLQSQQWHDSSPLTHAAEIVCPMLVVTGLRDTMTPTEQGKRMAAAVPRGRLMELPEMEHHPSPLDWELILDEAAGFLRLP